MAAHQVPLALGTDAAGSIRMPASLCGIVGLKPTFGRVSTRGLVASHNASVDHVGPLARTVADAALGLQVLAGYDALDSVSINEPVPDYVGGLDNRDSLHGIRVGIPSRYFFERVDPQVENGVRAAIESLGQLGATLVTVDIPDLEDMMPARPALFADGTMATAQSPICRMSHTRGVSSPCGAFEAARQRLARFAPHVDSVTAITLDTPRRQRRKEPGARSEFASADGPLQAAARALRSGETTSVALIEAALAAISRYDARTGAVVINLGDSALSTARALDADARADRWRGPLHSIPFSVKDNIDVDGQPTRAGSDAYYRVADRDADAVARMRASGGIPIAKVATHEFALGVTTPQARHPLDDRRIPGGSSGGSAISIATGMALASLGTDTRASIRVPSALCGVVGYKPTFGWLPRSGVVWLSWTMDHIGMLTGSVGDAAYVADALLPGRGLREACGVPVAGMRIGVPESSFSGATASVAAAARDAIEHLASAGASIVELDVPSADDFELSNAAGLIVSRGEAVEYHRWLGTKLGLVWPETADQMRIAEQLTLHEYLVAQRFRAELASRVLARLTAEQLDVLVMPTTLVTAPLVEDAEQHFTALSRNAIPWSLVDWPVVSVPCGRDEYGLPIGLQVVAPPEEDDQVLRVALRRSVHVDD